MEGEEGRASYGWRLGDVPLAAAKPGLWAGLIGVVLPFLTAIFLSPSPLRCVHLLFFSQELTPPPSEMIKSQTFKDSYLASSSPEGRKEREGTFPEHLLSLNNLPMVPQLV